MGEIKIGFLNRLQGIDFQSSCSSNKFEFIDTDSVQRVDIRCRLITERRFN